MSLLSPVSAGTLLRQPSFLFFLLSRSLTRFASQIGAVAIGWQIYELTGSAFELGMVGLVQFLPTALLVFVAGHVADRFERKRVVQLCQLAEAVTALFLCWGSYGGWLTEESKDMMVTGDRWQRGCQRRRWTKCTCPRDANVRIGSPE